ncbi:MAG: rod shape-determining protein MreC [Methylococcales bacterium]|jgi:rod shape-determining protein MreC|nr:rod shape-determining protein MreC [Methylococcales bacterium]MBT7442643.1 rod shape-determining protein MreC [Methylococcales bacterium]
MAVILSITIMVFDHHHRQTSAVRSGLSVLIYPVQYLVHLPIRGSEWLVENLSSRSTLAEENKTLKAEILQLRVNQQTTLAVEQENLRLRALLDSAKKIEERVLAAELLRVDMDPYQHQVRINKGYSDGVFSNQAIIDAYGVVGQVTHANTISSDVMLITDPSHAIPVQINRSNLRTIAVGTGHVNRLYLPYLPNNTTVKIGDLLVTSGLGGIFPPGYPVGTITGIEQSPGQPFAKVLATPIAHLENTRELLLVWREDLEDPRDLEDFSPEDDIELSLPKLNLDMESLQNEGSK